VVNRINFSQKPRPALTPAH